MSTETGTGVLTFSGIAIVGVFHDNIVVPPYANSLLAPVSEDTSIVGYNTFGGDMNPDFTGGKLYFRECGPTTGRAGLKKFHPDPPGTEILQKIESDIFGGTPSAPLHTLMTYPAGMVYHQNGYLYTVIDGSNSSPLTAINGTTLVSENIFGVTSSSTAPSGYDSTLKNYRICSSHQMIGMQTASVDFLVSCGIRGGVVREVAIFELDGAGIALVYVEDTAPSGFTVVVGPGHSGKDRSFCTFYAIVQDSNYSTGLNTPMTLIEYIFGDGNAPTRRDLLTIHPNTIDTDWSTFIIGAGPPGFDHADGNVLAMFQTADSVTNKAYLVKFSRANGDILWKLALPNGVPDMPLDKCNINGTLEFFTAVLAGNSFTTRVRLSDGVITNTTLWNKGISGPSLDSQVFDYLSGSITGNMGYSVGAGPVPTYLGTYLSDNADVIPSFRWGRIYMGTPYEDDAANPSPPGAVTRRIAWSFVLDGHTFYVLDLGTEGTFVFDDISRHWASFTTGGVTPQWNMAAGCMWGDRIVAGDLSTGQVWELDPNAVRDNGALDILHAATAFINRRSRDYVSVGVVRVAASVGKIQDGAGATLSLRFSDDQGQTWSDYYTVTLTQGDYSEEIAYRSLGSFAAPGRVFELTDTGGLLRIDGVDMNPEEDTGSAP